MRDVAMMLDIMHGPDSYDNLTYQAIGHYPDDEYSAHIVDKKALEGIKLGLPWDPYWQEASSWCCVSSERPETRDGIARQFDRRQPGRHYRPQHLRAPRRCPLGTVST